MAAVSSILETKRKEIFSITPDTSVYHALEIMVDKNVSALLVMENDKLVFYVHGALEGRKLDIIRNNSDCCVQIECDVQPFSGKVACQYGCSYYSFDGFGTAEIVEAPQEKIKAMSALMKIQTGKDFEFNERLVSIVSVIRIECDYYTAKYRPLPANPVV